MKAIVAACVGGLVGAIIWGAIAHFTGYEIGYIAWGIGALIGFLSAAAGGEGSTNGAICAVVAVLSLVAGKGLAVKFVLDKELKAALHPMYVEMQSDAQQFKAVSSKDDYPQFMFDHDYTVEESAADVGSAELAEFETETVPILEGLNDGWSYKQFEKHLTAGTNMIMEGLKESFGIIDVIFFLLGIATAYKIGAGSQET